MLTGCSKGYIITENTVEHTTWHKIYGKHDTLVKGADPKSFKALNDYYGVDKKSAWYWQQEVEGSDVKTFAVINDVYANDNRYGYFQGKRIKGSDGKTFQVSELSWSWSRDVNDYYYYGKKLNVCDIKTFKLLPDKLRGVDKRCYYYAGHKVEIMDRESLKILPVLYAKDKFQVYYDNYIIKNADPKTFNAFKDSKTGRYIIRDKRNCYYGTRVIPCNKQDE